MREKLGKIVRYERNGKVIARVANNRRLKTAEQMKPSKDLMASRLLNNWTIKMWNIIRPFSVGMWDNKTGGQTDFNLFTSVNRLAHCGVFLTKDEVGAVEVAAPVQISRGSLKTIQIDKDEDGRFVTNIQMRDLQLTADTNVHDLTISLLGFSDFEEGDNLTLVVVYQHPDKKQPSCTARAYTIELKRFDDRKVNSIIPEKFFSQKDDCLATTNQLPECCFTFIHTRGVSAEKQLVSTQVLTNNNQALIEQYLTDEQFQKAAESYGGLRENPFVEPW